MHSFSVLLLLLLLLLAPLPSSAGEDLVLRIEGEERRLGREVVALDDLDGDGVGDFAVTETFLSPVQVTVRSGASGAVLRTLVGTGSFGSVLEAPGDVDGDGTGDLLTIESGLVVVLSGVTGARIASVPWPEEPFGILAAAGAGDLDLDGAVDLVLGDAEKVTSIGGDVVLIFIDGAGFVAGVRTDGTALWRSDGAAHGDGYGASVAGIGDVDLDGVPDVAASCDNSAALTAGYVRVLDGASGGTLTERSFGPGATVHGIGDVDLDGRADLVAAGRFLGTTGGGRVEVLSAADGATVRAFDARGPYDRYGADVDGAGDVDGDGVPDLLVGASQPKLLGSGPGGFDIGPGYAEVRSVAVPGPLAVFSGHQIDGELGAAVAALGDVNGDGASEVLFGAPLVTPPGGPSEAGTASVHSIVPLTLSAASHELSVALGGVQRLALEAGPAYAGELALPLGSLTGIGPPLVVDGVALPLAFDAYTAFTLAHPGARPLSGGPALLDAQGGASFSFVVPPGAGGAPAGTAAWHAAYVLDAASGTALLGTPAVPAVLVP